MSTKLKGCWLIMLGLMGLPAIAAADPITIVRDQRFVTASAWVTTSSGVQLFDDDTTAPFSGDDLAAAAGVSFGGTEGSGHGTLSSSITPQGFSGTATLTSTATTDAARSSFGASGANFSVVFQLDAPHIFDYDVLFKAANSAGEEPFVHTTVALIAGLPPGPSKSMMDSTVFGRGAARRVTQGGVLSPGEYYFNVQEHVQSRVFAPGTVTTNGAFSFAFDLTPASPTPEPASLVLLTTGLMGVLGIRRRRSPR